MTAIEPQPSALKPQPSALDPAMRSRRSHITAIDREMRARQTPMTSRQTSMSPSLSPAAFRALADKLKLGLGQRPTPRASHGTDQLDLREARDAPACAAGEVRMKMRTVVLSAHLVPSNATHATCNAGQIRLDELDQVSVERGLIPLGIPDGFHHLGVRQRSLRLGQKSQDRHARGGRAQPGFLHPSLRFVSGKRCHRAHRSGDDLHLQAICKSGIGRPCPTVISQERPSTRPPDTMISPSSSSPSRTCDRRASSARA